MHAHSRWMPLSATITFALAGTLLAPAQDWQTVDDFTLGGGSAEAHGVLVDRGRHIYVVGTAGGHAILRYSADGGATWTTRDDFLYPGQTNNNVFSGITTGGDGALYVGGGSGGHWIVRRSMDQGVSWQIVDDYYAPRNGPIQGTNASVFSLSSAADGRVYGTGNMIQTGPSYPNWLVRGSDIGGTNWDTKLILPASYGSVSQLTCAGEDVYVTGYTDDGPGSAVGSIRGSSDHGATWGTNFEGSNEIYYGITSDSDANVYAAGTRWNSTNGFGSTADWLVRKAPPGGTNWTTLDAASYDNSSESGKAPSPSCIAVDAAGNICVAGRLQNRWVIQETNGYTYAGNQTWFTRQFSAASGQWSTTDFFSYYPTNSANWTNMHSVALGAAIAPDGSTFVVGYGTAETGQRHWVVRKRDAARPPRLNIAAANGSVTVSWPSGYTNWVLEWSGSPSANASWQTFTETVAETDGQKLATCGCTPGARFFRLRNTAAQ